MTFGQTQKWGTIAALGAVLLGSLLAWAQGEVLLTGTDSNNTVRQVRVDSSGRLVTGAAPASCSLTQTSVDVGTTAGGTATPTSATSGRSYVVLCNSKVNASGLVKCRADGSAPVYATGGGTVLDVGDCVMFSVGASVTPKCIASAGTVTVETTECVPQ